VVRNNVVAWNYAGISIISQNRGLQRWNDVTGNRIQDNHVFIVEAGQANRAVSWVQDWNGTLTNPASNNTGANNSYFHSNPVGHYWTFSYGDQNFNRSQLPQYNGTHGEQNGSYLSNAQKDQILSSAGVPTRGERQQ
jgi:hypothetical protein